MSSSNVGPRGVDLSLSSCISIHTNSERGNMLDCSIHIRIKKPNMLLSIYTNEYNMD